jgi:hypothetical protein
MTLSFRKRNELLSLGLTSQHGSCGTTSLLAFQQEYVMANTEEGSKRGFASMDEEKQREIASKGGQSQGKENNPGNFANDHEKAAEAGRKGGESRGEQ